MPITAYRAFFVPRGLFNGQRMPVRVYRGRGAVSRRNSLVGVGLGPRDTINHSTEGKTQATAPL